MKDAGIQPSQGMYHDLNSFAQTNAGVEHAAIINQRVGEDRLDLRLFATIY